MSWFAVSSAALIALPAITRATQAWRYRALLGLPLGEGLEARDSSRAVIIALAGFSFTGVAGLAVLESTTEGQKLQMSVAFFLISFLFCIFALQLENYKFFLGRELLSSYLTESAILMLLIAIVAIVVSGSYGTCFKAFVALLSFAGWLADHFLEWRYMNNHLRLVQEAQCKSKSETTNS